MRFLLLLLLWVPGHSAIWRSKFSFKEKFEVPKSSELSDWMGKLPKRLLQKPLAQLKIPGSHDSGANGNLNSSYPFATNAFKRKRMEINILNWGRTQNLTILEQLEVGIRYLDLRVDHPRPESEIGDFRLVHLFTGELLSDALKQVKKFTDHHPNEIVLLDMNHIYGIQQHDTETVRRLREQIISILGKKTMCPQKEGVTLEYMRRNGYRHIVFVEKKYASQFPAPFWSHKMIESPWPNLVHLYDLIEFLKVHLIRKKPLIFHVTQAVLTPDVNFYLHHLTETHAEALGKPAKEAVIELIRGKKLSANRNIIITDDVDEEFSTAVIKMNLLL